MAKPLADRIRAALGPQSRLADVRAVLADTQAERQRLATAQTAAHRRRVDPTTSHADASAANTEAQDCQWQLDRLDAAMEGLNERIATIEADESYQQRRDAFEAARKARDELAARLKERVPALFEELLDLVDACEADRQRVGQVNQERPNGQPALLAAEPFARGCHSHLGPNHSPVVKLADLQLMNFFDGGLMMSRAEHRRRGVRTRIQEDERRQRLAYQADWGKAKLDLVAKTKWRPVAIRAHGPAAVIGVENRDGECNIEGTWFIVEMDEAQIRKARAKNVIVEPMSLTEHKGANVHSQVRHRWAQNPPAAAFEPA